MQSFDSRLSYIYNTRRPYIWKLLKNYRKDYDFCLNNSFLFTLLKYSGLKLIYDFNTHTHEQHRTSIFVQPQPKNPIQIPLRVWEKKHRYGVPEKTRSAVG